MSEPIVMENEGHERVEHCPRWNWENGSVSYGPIFTDPVVVQEFLDAPPFGVKHGELVQRTITTTPWTPVLPDGVLRLDQVGAEEYGGIRVAELGDGVVEGYNLVAFTGDPEKALAAVRAHFAMCNEVPELALRWENEPVRWWQVFDSCGCGDTCPHGEGEDHECARWGLPPCVTEDDDGSSWIGVLCGPDAPGALPFVEVEVGAVLTPDERVVMLRGQLGAAHLRMRELVEACVAVKPTLEQSSGTAPGASLWTQFVDKPARAAQGLVWEIQQALRFQVGREDEVRP